MSLKQGKNSISASYATYNKFGDMTISCPQSLGADTIAKQMGPRPSGCGTWWPDFGPTRRDFSYQDRIHPTQPIFERAFGLHSGPMTGVDGKPIAEPMRGGGSSPSQLKQFRHPKPQTEALWSSTVIMPYKSGGRRKCGEDSNWKCALSAGAKMPIFAKGPLLNDPDRHQLHPFSSGEEKVNIEKSCSAEQLRAGGTSSTSPVEALLRTNKTEASLGIRTTQKMRQEMTFDASKSVNRLHTSTLGGTIRAGNVKFDDTRSEVSSVSAASAVPSRQEKLPYWVAGRTIATRDADAAGHAACLLRKAHSTGGLVGSQPSSSVGTPRSRGALR